MFSIEIPESQFEKMRLHLANICPYVQFRLIAKDVNLARLGFADEPPCLVEFDIDDDTYFKMIGDLEQLEVDAYNEPYDQDSVDRYEKYGWLWGLFRNAEERGSIRFSD